MKPFALLLSLLMICAEAAAASSVLLERLHDAGRFPAAANPFGAAGRELLPQQSAASVAVSPDLCGVALGNSPLCAAASASREVSHDAPQRYFTPIEPGAGSADAPAFRREWVLDPASYVALFGSQGASAGFLSGRQAGYHQPLGGAQGLIGSLGGSAASGLDAAVEIISTKVPLPPTMALFVFGLGALGIAGRGPRRRVANAPDCR